MSGEQLTLTGVADLPARGGEGAKPRGAQGKWKPDVRQVTVSDLPESLREISRLIGLPATLTLAEKLGGQRLSIPGDIGEKHPLTPVIGLHAARLLAGHFKGERLDVPSFARVIAPLRDRSIRADFDAGVSIRDLVQRYSLVDRRVRIILNSADGP